MEIEVLSPSDWFMALRRVNHISFPEQSVIRNSPLEHPRELTSKSRVVFIMPCHLGVCVDKFRAMTANLFGKMKAWRHEAKIFMKKMFHSWDEKQTKRPWSVGRQRIAGDSAEKKQSWAAISDHRDAYRRPFSWNLFLMLNILSTSTILKGSRRNRRDPSPLSQPQSDRNGFLPAPAAHKRHVHRQL